MKSIQMHPKKLFYLHHVNFECDPLTKKQTMNFIHTSEKCTLYLSNIKNSTFLTEFYADNNIFPIKLSGKTYSQSKIS